MDKLRINPGNIGDKEKVRLVVEAAKAANISIRIGVNAGSLEKELLEKYGHPTPEAMVESAEKHIAYLEELDFNNIVVSMKASDVRFTIDAYTLFLRNTIIQCIWALRRPASCGHRRLNRALALAICC